MHVQSNGEVADPSQANGAGSDGGEPPKAPRVLWLTFSSVRSHENQDLYARGLARMLAHDLNRAEPGVAAAAILTARREGLKGFVLPQLPSEPGPLVALGEALSIRWVVQGFCRVTPDQVDVQMQWVDSQKAQVSAVQRFAGTRVELGKVLDQARKAAAVAFGVGLAPSMPPPVWNQTKSIEAFEAFLLYLDNSMLLFDPSERPMVGELRDPVDCLREALKHDRYFRAASDALASEDAFKLNSFGTLLEIDVDSGSLL